MRKGIHYCQLTKKSTCFPKLPPNASIFRRILRVFQKHATLDMDSARSRRHFRNKSSMMVEQRRHIRSDYSYVLHPFSKYNRIREIVFMLVWAWEIFNIPILGSFDLTYAILDEGMMYFSNLRNWIMLYILLPIELILIASELVTGYVDQATKEIIIEPTRIIRHYFKTYFTIDLILVLLYKDEGYLKKPLFVFNFLIIFRLNTLNRYFRNIMLDCKIQEEVYRCIALVILTGYVLNLFNCFFIFVPNFLYEDLDVWPSASWFNTAGILPSSNVQGYEAYAECLMLIVCHFFGAGQGMYKLNYVPSEQIMLSLVMIIGRLWTLVLIANLLRIFTVVTISETKYEEYLLQLEVYIQQKKLPKKLRARLLEYYEYKYQCHFFNEQAIFATLSNYLKEELVMYSARELISKVQLFKHFSRTVVASIVMNAKVNVYLEGDILVKPNEPIKAIHFISAGSVAVLSPERIEMGHLVDGEELGIRGLLEKTAIFNFYYIAIEPTEIYTIPLSELKNLGAKKETLRYFSEKVSQRLQDYKTNEREQKLVAYDMLTELSAGKILEHPRARTRHFED